MEKNIIEEFSQLKSKEKAEDFYKKFLDILTSALQEIISKNKIISQENTRIFPIGEYTNKTYIEEVGELDIVLATSEPQILISNKLFLDELKNTKTKKSKNLLPHKNTSQQLVELLFEKLTNYFEEETVLMIIDNGIKILCNKEFGFKVILRVGTFVAEKDDYKLKFWNPLSMSEREIDIFAYQEAQDKKDYETNGNFKKIVRIYKNLRKSLLLNKMSSSSEFNKFFVELLAYNVPNSLISSGDVYQNFVKSFNYLHNCNLKDFKNVDGKSIQNFGLANVSFSTIKSFLNKLKSVAF